MSKRLFHRDFERRLVRLHHAIEKALIEGKEADLFACLFQVFSYLWTGNVARLKTNGNYER